MDDDTIKHLVNLARYIDEDVIYQEYLVNKDMELSDFDRFCVEHIEDVDVALGLVTSLIDNIIEVTKERNALMEALSLVRQKKNNDKAKYRRKAKVLRDRINETIADIDRQINSCTAEAEGTINNEKCWMAINYLKKLKSMLKK